jgi:GntR family transcriptional regulator
MARPALTRHCSQRDTPAFSPLYQQIKGLILQSLQAGEWKPSTAIPSEIELAGALQGQPGHGAQGH